MVKQIARKINEPSTREDILQEVFLKFASKIETIDHQENLCGYLYRITENAINDHYRQSKRYLFINKDEVLYQSITTSQVDAYSQLDELANCCLRLLIDRLPSKYREALILIELEGQAQKEVSVALGLSYSGLKSRVQRGREKLKEIILACCQVEFDKYGNVVVCDNKAD